jgi:hypothetical protein
MTGISLNELFQFSESDVDKGVAEYAKEHTDAASGLAGFAASIAAQELNKALDVDIFELFAEAWIKARSIKEYGDRAKHPPGESAVVTLGETELTSTSYPVLELSVSGMKLPVLKFTLELVAKFETVQLAISDARIRSMKPGEAAVVVRLKYGDATLKEVSTAKWKLPGSIAFGNGIPIPG